MFFVRVLTLTITSLLAVPITSWKTCEVPLLAGTINSSPDILETFAACSQDATILFPANKTYTLGSVLSLISLNNVYIQLFGKLQYDNNDLRYWIQNSFYQQFQNVSIALEIGGHNITIDGGGTGVIDGQGQTWYDYANQFSQYFGRPIPFSIRRGSNVTAKDFEVRNSQYWSFLISNSSDVTVDHVIVNNTSITRADEYPGNLVNTDGFDTLYSDNIRILNSWVHNGDDCVAIKPNTTNLLVQNMTCVQSGGIPIGSLGQYQGLFDLAENITVKDSTFINSQNGAWMKTWSGAVTPLVYPPNGGGNGTGLIKNVLYQNLTMFNVSNPIVVNMCNSYSQYGAALPCQDTPTSFQIENVVWDGINVHGGTGRVVDLECLGKTGCNEMAIKNIVVNNRTFATGENQWSCAGVNGVKEGCGALINRTSSR